MANRTDKFVEDKFLHEGHSKDGFPVRECRIDQERKVLEFLVPIVHLNKPTQVTQTLENTIFRVLEGDRPIDWSKIFMDLVNRLVGGAGKSKPTPICPFGYHLYESQGLQTEEEETDYWVAQELTQYQIIPDQDGDSKPKSEGVKIITTLAPTVQKLVVVPAN